MRYQDSFHADQDATLPCLGVVIVTYNSAGIIRDCLESLLSSEGLQLRVVLVDNASTDGTCSVLRDWAEGRVPYEVPSDIPFDLVPYPKPLGLHRPDDLLGGDGHAVALIEQEVNGGFAAGVNRGLTYLLSRPEIDRFWILNPDCVVPPRTPAALATATVPGGGFSLMGGRLVYLSSPSNVIQIDGGTIGWATGVTGNQNQYGFHPEVPPPDPAQLDFITGASMVVSREFCEEAGPMREDYFLYYEEVDWALRRGNLPLAYCPDAIVYHRAGTAIGSPAPGRPASPFSLYFKHRGRMLFLRRHFPWAVPTGLAYSFAKAGQLAIKGYPFEAWTVLAGSLGLAPPETVRERLSPEAQALAFGRSRP